MTGVKLAGLYSFGKIAAYLSRTDQTFSEPLEVSARFPAFASSRTQTAVRENARSEAKARPAKGPEKTALLRLAKDHGVSIPFRFLAGIFPTLRRASQVVDS